MRRRNVKRKLNTPPPGSPEAVTISESQLNDSDNEVVFNIGPQAKKFKKDPEIQSPAAVEINKKVSEIKNETKVEDPEELKPRRSPNGYILPDPLPQGLVITDLKNQKWKIGKSVGLGGFGEIYSAALLTGHSLSAEDYVVKVEPHSNGPLFVELHFYCRATRREDLDSFAANRKIKHLGVPDLKGHGSFMHRKKKLRFIVMPRYGTDLQTVVDQQKSALSLESTSCLATQVLDSLEYLHSMGYVHKDLKGNNMIYKRDHTGINDKIFLVDYGLASRYIHMGIHRPFEPDQRSAHEGTLEYVSRDGHLGCVSRRGDMECLLYVIIEWLGGHLPWDTDDDDRLKPDVIQQMKIEAFHDIKGFLAFKAFKNKTYPPLVEDLMKMVKEMRFEEAPDYHQFRALFRPHLPPKINDAEREKENLDENYNKENILCDIPEDDEVKFTQPILKKPSKRRSLPLTLKRQQSVSQPWSPNQMQTYNDHRNSIIRSYCKESIQNPTPAMTEQMNRMQKRSEGLLPNFFTPRRKGIVRRLSEDIDPKFFTHRRKGLIAKRRNRRASGESNNGDNPSLRNLIRTPMKRDTPSVRRSPRRAEKTLGQHLYGIVAPGLGAVSSLVKSMFQTQRLRPRRQISK